MSRGCQPDKRRSWLSAINTSHSETSNSKAEGTRVSEELEGPKGGGKTQQLPLTSLRSTVLLRNLDAVMSGETHSLGQLLVMPHCKCLKNEQLIIGLARNRYLRGVERELRHNL
ncbi:hypothetical protein E3U43_016322 [Larimichthys crocea]|uniref:Uncharacterized protein n=1 Tax=Larimichthys crocea TaxID=215358 RepID=A0ACD3QJ44_LARCR|nr:hypothetical protein E3U43_016322 [Larimichthys crocea]